MLDYTKVALQKTLADLKRVDYWRNVITQIMYMTYLIYTLIAQRGLWIINAVLLAICTVYFVFFLILTNVGKDPEAKKARQAKKIGTNVFKWSKRVIKLFIIGITIYGIAQAASNVSTLSVILCAGMIIALILDILFEVLIKIIVNRANYFMEALESDIAEVMKPVKTVTNFFKKFTGQEVEEPKPPTATKLKLMEQVKQYREKKKAEREQKKADYKLKKAEEKKFKKEQKIEQKRSIKALKSHKNQPEIVDNDVEIGNYPSITGK